MDRDNCPQNEQIIPSHAFKPDNGRGSDCFIKQSKLYQESKNYLPDDVLTLRIKIFSKETIPVPKLTKSFLRTHIPIWKCISEWNINGASDLTSESSHKISLNDIFKTDYSIGVTTTYFRTHIDKFLKICVSVDKDFDFDKYSWKYCIFNQSTKEDFFKASGQLSTLKNEDIFQPLISWQEMTKNCAKYFQNDTLKLICKFCIISHGLINSGETIDVRKPQASTVFNTITDNIDQSSDTKWTTKYSLTNDSLTNDVHQMYLDRFLSDFTVQVGSRLFPAHANILGARSAVLRCMLETNMQEKREKVLKLDDLDEKTVEQFLQFLYTDDPGDLCVKSALKLYYASDKYQVSGLKYKTRMFLKDCVDTSNVFDVLLLSDRHNDQELKSSAIQFISRHEKDVVLSDEFKLFSKENPQLSVDTSNVFDVLLFSDRHNDQDLNFLAIMFIYRHETDVVLSDEFKLFSKENLQLSFDILLRLSEMRLTDL